MWQAKLRVGHVHLTLNEVVPLCSTNRCYTWLASAAVASHSQPRCCALGEVRPALPALVRLCVYQVNSCLMQEWLHTAGGHIKVENCCSEAHLKENGFRSVDQSLVLALSLGRGLSRIVARVRGVLGHLAHTAALWLAVASHCCSD